ncbi:MAG: DMT family transporter [Rhodospirillales bacterium]|nr:DMT family transporter [Rhodospirillales bacterium]
MIFFRNLFAFLPLLPVLARAGGLALLRTERLGAHIGRAAMGFGAMICFFTAFSLMPLADVVAISLSAPIFITALSVPLLAEQVGPRRWAAVMVGFLGVLVMVRPGGASLIEPVALLPLTGAVLYALALIAMRKLGATERATTTVFYFTLVCTALSGLAQPFVWRMPDLPDFVLLVCVGLLGGSAQLLMTQSLRIAPAAVVAPFDYSALVFSIGFGFAFWGEVPDWMLLLGAAIVVASGLYILHRETLRRRRGRKSGAGA